MHSAMSAEESFRHERGENMELLGFTAVPAITVICYLLGEAVKDSGLDNKYIPLTCGLGGLVLGIAAMYIMPSFPGTDLLTSAAIGVVSGLAATGVHQTIRQLSDR